MNQVFCYEADLLDYNKHRDLIEQAVIVEVDKRKTNITSDKVGCWDIEIAQQIKFCGTCMSTPVQCPKLHKKSWTWWNTPVILGLGDRELGGMGVCDFLELSAQTA